jgi:hypothetical protein
LLGVDTIETVADDFADCTMEFGGQLRAGSTGADDRDVQLAGSHRLGLGLRAQACVD